MNGPTKAHFHPYGSTVIPHNGAVAVEANTPKLPGSPSLIPGSLGVAGAPVLRDLSGTSSETKPTNAVTKALDDLFEAFADRVADKIIAKLAANIPTTPELDVEDLNRLYQQPPGFGEASMEDLVQTQPHDATQMHVDLEQALREREHVKVKRFAPGPLAFTVTIEGAEVVPDYGDGWSRGLRNCTVYAQPYGQGYTNGAKPNEYVLLCGGKQVYRSESYREGPQSFQAGRGFGFHAGTFDGDYSTGLTFDEVLAIVDGPMRSESWGADS
jgi:hypothetical protein